MNDGRTRWLSFSLPTGNTRREIQQRQRLLVVGALFAGVVLLALRVTSYTRPERMLRDPLLIVLPLIPALLLLLRWPELGLVGIVVAALVAPFSIGTGTQTRLNAAILLLGLLLALWVYQMVVHRRFWLAPARTTLPLLLFVAVAALSLLIGQLPWFVFAQKASLMAQLGGLGVFVLAAGAFLIVANQVHSLRWLEWMTFLYIAIGAVYIIGQIVPFLRPFAHDLVQERAYSNSAFWVWLAALTFSQAFFNNRLNPLVRVGLVWLVVGIFFVALVQESGWTSGWLPPLIAVAVILLASGSRWGWVVTLVGALGVALKAQGFTSRLLLAGDNQYSLMTRLEAWRIIAEMVKVNPIFGLGPANYYWYTPLYSILGYTVQFNSHNNYVDIVAQTGLLGLAAFVWFAVELIGVGWRLRALVPEGFAQAYVVGALGGLVGMLAAGMLGDWMLPFIYNIGLHGFRASLVGWLFLGGLAAIQQMVRRGELGRPGEAKE